MRWWQRLGLGPTAAVLTAGLVTATVGQAATLPFSGSISFQIGAAGVALPGSGVATLDGSGGAGHLDTLALPAAAFATTGLSLPVLDPAVAPIAGLRLTVRNAAATLSPGGAMPLLGVVRVCLFASCGASPTANLSVPLSVVGAGGQAFATGPVNLTVGGAPWTLGTASVGAVSAAGFGHGPASATSSTAQASGELQLVTPVYVSTRLGDASGLLPGFAILNLHFAPEPASALLVGLGLAGLVTARRRAQHPG